MVSQEMAVKLRLHYDNHSHPYRIAWFKKGNEVTITKRYLIKFSIGKTYKYEVWCDVIMMDACHLLLGRPCQYMTEKSYMMEGRILTPSRRMDLRSYYCPLRMKRRLRICCHKKSLLQK